MNWKKWLYGLLAALIGGAANSVSVMIVDPKDFNFNDGFTRLAAVASVSAIVAAAMYLQKTPLPPLNSTEESK